MSGIGEQNLHLLGSALIYSGLLVVAFVISTLVIRLGVPRLKTDFVETKSTAGTPAERLARLLAEGRLPESSKSGTIFDWQSTGFWIGLTETVLIFVLVAAEAYSALAIIIGAKQFVRNEKIQIAPSYYLLGTLANLSIAVCFALLAKHLIVLQSSIS